MARWLALPIVIASLPARAEPPAAPIARLGGTVGFQQTDRSAWVFGPSLEIKILDELSIHADAQLELGDFDDPFGDTNIRDGEGPHVNHVLLGPTWRPSRFAAHQLALGAEAGILVMHSTFSAEHFTTRPAAGLFVQAGRALGPVNLALQLRLDLSTSVAMAGPAGDDVATTSARINLAFEIPIPFR